MTEKKFKHLNVQVPSGLYDEFKAVVPWGLRMHLFQSILQLILDAIRADGAIVMGALMSGEYRLTIARRAVQNLNKDTGNGST